MNEDIVYVARLHWIIFTGPVVLLLLTCLGYVFLPLPHLGLVAAFLLVFALLWGLMVWVNYQFSSLTIKKKQLILRTGLLVRFTTDLPLARIESLDIRQTVLGSVLQYGTLLIIGTGGSRQLIHYVAKPLTCRRYIEQIMYG